MIARLTVVDGTLTEYPLAEKVRGGWQNGVTFYPDEKVTNALKVHVCEECPTCGLHEGRHNKCCGCYDGVCCQENEREGAHASS